jgi:hypothetical protein
MGWQPRELSSVGRLASTAAVAGAPRNKYPPLPPARRRRGGRRTGGPVPCPRDPRALARPMRQARSPSRPSATDTWRDGGTPARAPPRSRPWGDTRRSPAPRPACRDEAGELEARGAGSTGQ